MDIVSEGIVCAVLGHGEHGAIVRLFTPANGLMAGYVRGGRSRRLRPVLQPGNLVAAHLRARVDEQLAAATVELTASRAGIAGTRAGAAALGWLAALMAQSLPEAMPYPVLYERLAALLEAIDRNGMTLEVAAGLVRFELELLSELGFGLDLSSCAATGRSDDLAYVSPRSARAVSGEAGAPYAAKLLPLPAFLLDGERAARGWAEIVDGLATTGFFIERHLLIGPAQRLEPARAQLVAVIGRMPQPACRARAAGRGLPRRSGRRSGWSRHGRSWWR